MVFIVCVVINNQRAIGDGLHIALIPSVHKTDWKTFSSPFLTARAFQLRDDSRLHFKQCIVLVTKQMKGQIAVVKFSSLSLHFIRVMSMNCSIKSYPKNRTADIKLAVCQR